MSERTCTCDVGCSVLVKLTLSDVSGLACDEVRGSSEVTGSGCEAVEIVETVEVVSE